MSRICGDSRSPSSAADESTEDLDEGKDKGKGEQKDDSQAMKHKGKGKSKDEAKGKGPPFIVAYNLLCFLANYTWQWSVVSRSAIYVFICDPKLF